MNKFLKKNWIVIAIIVIALFLFKNKKAVSQFLEANGIDLGQGGSGSGSGSGGGGGSVSTETPVKIVTRDRSYVDLSVSRIDKPTEVVSSAMTLASAGSSKPMPTSTTVKTDSTKLTTSLAG